MLISSTLAQAINTQIGNELGASLQYYQIAAHFHTAHLLQLATLFTKQAEEERAHADKLMRYVLETGGGVRLPAIREPQHTFPSCEAAVEAALKWELEVTAQIKSLMDIAASEGDYLAQGFLQWFVDEQLEEVTKMQRLLGVVRMAGERNLLSVEAYLVHGHD